MTENAKEQLEHLSEIKEMMKESSQFLSLSGLSGVFAGIFALAGAALVWTDFFDLVAPESIGSQRISYPAEGVAIWARVAFLLIVGVGVLFSSLLMGFILTARKAKKSGRKLFETAAKKLLLNLFIPLFFGGIF